MVKPLDCAPDNVLLGKPAPLVTCLLAIASPSVSGGRARGALGAQTMMEAVGKPQKMIWLALAGLALAWGLPQLGLPNLFAPGSSVLMRVSRELVWWAIGAGMLLWVLRVEKLPLSSIGLKRPTMGTFLWGGVFTILMMATVMLCYAVIFPAFDLKLNQRVVASITSTPLWLQCAIMLRAGVVEEILYRGYAIERLQWLTGSKWVAGLVSAAVFILMHLAGWGAAQLIVVAFGAALLTILYLWRRDLPCAMIAHILTDLIGFGLARLQG